MKIWKIEHRNAKVKNFLAKHYPAKWNCFSLYQESEIIPLRKFPSTLSSQSAFSILTMGTVFHERRWKITFRSRAIALARCVFRVQSRSRRAARGFANPLASTTFRPNPPRIWNPWKFAASCPTSAKWMHKFLVVCFRRAAAAAVAANAITRRVSLWLAASASTRKWANKQNRI